MDLRRQRKRAAVFFPTCTEVAWLDSWPVRPLEGPIDLEARVPKPHEQTVEFELLPEREVREKPGREREAVDVLDAEVAWVQVRALYERSAVAQAAEADVKKRKSRVQTKLKVKLWPAPTGVPRTIVRKLGKWSYLVEDPDWPAVVGRGSSEWTAEHSLRVQVAMLVWRLMGGKLDAARSPLPARLDKYDDTWVAASMKGVRWKPLPGTRRKPFPTCGTGKTAEEALLDLCKALKLDLGKTPPIPWGFRETGFKGGPDPHGP